MEQDERRASGFSRVPLEVVMAQSGAFEATFGDHRWPSLANPRRLHL